MNRLTRLASCALCLVVTSASLTGCLSLNPSESTEQQANSAYVSTLHAQISQLQKTLADFDEAASRGDVVAMQAQLDAANNTLDEIKKIQPPAALKDITGSYVDGLDKLKGALTDYSQAVRDLTQSQKDAQGHYSAAALEKYNTAFKAVQDSYNQGVSALENADKAAAQGGEPKDKAKK